MVGGNAPHARFRGRAARPCHRTREALHRLPLLPDTDCVIANAELWKRTYPHDIEPSMNLCYSYGSARGEFAKALPNCVEELRREPGHWLAVANLAGVNISLDRYDEARRVLNDAMHGSLTRRRFAF